MGGIFRTSSPGDSISGDPKRTILSRWWGGVRLYRNSQQGIGSLKMKILLLIKEKQISQVKKFSHFLCMEKYKSLGLLKSFLSYVSQLSWAGSYFFPHPELPGAHHREWLQPEAARPQACFSFLSALRAQKLTSEHCKR